MNLGYLHASRWFRNAERIWDISKTEKNKAMSAVDYLNWLNKLTDQNLNAEYVVLYNSSAKDANAAIVKRTDIDLEFIAESKSYVYYTLDENEAYYLSAILNSSIPNLLMKDFQTKGLFGARDVHKKILDIYFPKFDAGDEVHTRLAEYGRVCHEKVAKYMETNPPTKELTPHTLGKLRLDIKAYLSEELSQIDKLVKKVMKQ
jgi:hypothetical protein